MRQCVIGIIGHRDLRTDDKRAIKRAVHSWVNDQFARKEVKENTVTLLTSLARGSDQLATELLSTALGTKLAVPSKSLLRLAQHFPTRNLSRWLRVKQSIEVVFPYEAEAYRQEIFSSQEHGPRDDYEEAALKTWCDAVLDEALKAKPEVCDPKWVPPPKKGGAPANCERTDKAYRAAGRFIVERAHILIALWDGNYTGLKGGTSDTIHYALSDECQSRRRKAKLPPIEIHWLVTPRRCNHFPANEAFTWETLYVSTSNRIPSAQGGKVFRNRANRWFRLMLLVGISAVLCSWLGNLPRPATFAVKIDRLFIAISHLVLNGLDTAPDGATVLDHFASANMDANAELMRLALRLATGAGQDHSHGDTHRLADNQCHPPTGEQTFHGRLPGLRTRFDYQGPIARPSAQMIAKPRTLTAPRHPAVRRDISPAPDLSPLPS